MTARRRRVDASDDAVVLLRNLTDPQWRAAVESRTGVFIAEGETVIERVVSAGLRVRSILGEESRIDVLESRGLLGDADVLVADADVLRDITGYRVHRGALAVVDRPPPLSIDSVLAGGGDIVVLEDLVDPTNVGLVARSAAALGISALVLSPRCADPLYRRAVKVSMGAVLSLPWSRSHDWPADLDRLADAGIDLLGLSPQGDDLDGYLAAPAERIGWVLGTEGPGLSAASVQRCRALVGIPMEPPIDSLNVAAATAVACFALRGARRRDRMRS